MITRINEIADKTLRLKQIRLLRDKDFSMDLKHILSDQYGKNYFMAREVNNEENLGIRLYTIPLDDIIYCFGMMLTVASLYEFFLTRKLKKQVPQLKTF